MPADPEPDPGTGPTYFHIEIEDVAGGGDWHVAIDDLADPKAGDFSIAVDDLTTDRQVASISVESI